VHRTIKISPGNVNSSTEKQILQSSYNHLKIFVASKFRKGAMFVLVNINICHEFTVKLFFIKTLNSFLLTLLKLYR